MSDLANYYDSRERALELEGRGDWLMAAVEHWMCYQYGEHGEFTMLPDTSLGPDSLQRFKRLVKRLPYASLSKSTFITGCQCPKALWLYKNKYDRRHVSPEVQRKFDVGHAIGKLAQRLFPDGTDASKHGYERKLEVLQWQTPLEVPPLPFILRQNLWLRGTEHLVANRKASIYEAAFSRNGVFAAVDILTHTDGQWVAWEVKSSFDVHDVYLLDCALQYHVINHHVPLHDFALVYPDAEYANSLGIDLSQLTEDNCDIQRLFKTRSILDIVREMQPTVEQRLAALRPVLVQRSEPRTAMGEQCTAPYPCPFVRYCSEADDYCRR